MSGGVRLRAGDAGVVLGSPAFPVADGQFMRYDAAAGLWFAVDAPGGGVRPAGQYSLTVADSSFFDTGADANLHYITGADFVEDTPCDGLDFTPAQCGLTVARAGDYTVKAEFSCFGNTGYMVSTFDLNGNVVGTAPAVGINAAPCAGEDIQHFAFLSVTRVFKGLSVGDVLRPVAAFAGVFGGFAQLTIDQLILIAEPR